jgi:hypothetical protein
MRVALRPHPSRHPPRGRSAESESPRDCPAAEGSNAVCKCAPLCRRGDDRARPLVTSHAVPLYPARPGVPDEVPPRRSRHHRTPRPRRLHRMLTTPSRQPAELYRAAALGGRRCRGSARPPSARPPSSSSRVSGRAAARGTAVDSVASRTPRSTARSSPRARHGACESVRRPSRRLRPPRRAAHSASAPARPWCSPPVRRPRCCARHTALVVTATDRVDSLPSPLNGRDRSPGDRRRVHERRPASGGTEPRRASRARTTQTTSRRRTTSPTTRLSSSPRRLEPGTAASVPPRYRRACAQPSRRAPAQPGVSRAGR